MRKTLQLEGRFTASLMVERCLEDLGATPGSFFMRETWYTTLDRRFNTKEVVDMLELRNLSIRLKKTGFELVKELSITLNRGDKVAVIGHEGTGKSTLLKALLDRDLQTHVDVFGEMRCRGTIGYLEQDLGKTWNQCRIQDYFVKDTPDGPIRYERYENLKHLSEVFERLGFSEKSYHDNKTLSQFSGGELVKLNLAKLLIQDVDVFLLDEPTNDLDFETILFLESFIQTENRPILFVSHDEKLLENTANGIVHLQRVQKRTKAKTYSEWCGYQEYRDLRLRVYRSKLMQARKQRSDYKKKMERFRQIYQKVAHEQDQTVRNPSKARLLKKKIKHMKSIEKNIEREKDRFIPIPEKEDHIDIFFSDSVSIPKGKRVIDYRRKELKRDNRVLSKDIELSIVGPEKVAIIGKNGVGKSTLMADLYEELKTRDDISVAYMPQDYEDLNEDVPVLEFLNADYDRKKEAKARKMLGALAFEREEMTVSTRSLSGGQRAKLYFLKMILDENDVLLLDEPTRNLSPLSAPEVHEMLLNFKGAIIAITHDRTFIENVIDTLYSLDETTFSKV